MWVKVFLPIFITLGSLTVILGLGFDHYQLYLDQCVEREKVVSDADINRKCRLMEVEALIEEKKFEASIRSSQILERENARELNHAANMAKINNSMLGSASKWPWLYIVTGIAGLGIYFYSGNIENLFTSFTLLSEGITE